MSTITVTIRERSEWMRRKVSTRTQELAPYRVAGTTLCAPLGLPTKVGSPEDRTCDRCRTYTRGASPFYCAVLKEADLVLVVGLCARCLTYEGVS